MNKNPILIGTSSTMAIDGKINKVCNDYRCLTNKDVKMQALGNIATNLGKFKFILLIYSRLYRLRNRRDLQIKALIISYYN